MKKISLIVTTFRGQETIAISELRDLLVYLGDANPEVEMTKVSGLITASTSLDPLDVIEKVRSILSSEPWRISSLLRFIPIEETVPTRIEEIVNTVERLSKKIPEGASFRITVEKRHTSLSSKEIIKATAEKVDRRVDLENPDYIVLVEILGGVTGVSVIKPNQIISTMKKESIN
ncbi:MAG: THUMP domain-containing protein [Candidatus Caldarchaeales archaeon]